MRRRGSVRWLLIFGCWWLVGLSPSYSASLPLQWSQAGASAWMRGTFDNVALAGDRVVLAQRLQLDWEQSLGQLNGPARGLALDPQRNLLISGYTQQGSGEVAHVLKCTPDGQVLWERTEGPGRSNRSMGVTSDAQGNVYVAGFTWLGGNDYQLLKYDPQGRPLWKRLFSGGGDDRAQAVAVDPQGRVVVTGTSTLNDADVLTLQYDAGGKLRWQRRFDGGGGDWGWDVAVNAAGEAYVAGSTLVAGQLDLLLLKYDADGRLLWRRTYDAGGEETATAIALDGRVAVAGFSQGASGDGFLVAVFDGQGRLQWVRQRDQSPRDRAFGAAWDGQGNLVLTGSAQVNGSEQFTTLKFDSRGSLLWTRGEAGPGAGRGYAVKVDDRGRIFVTGWQGTGYRTLRYRDGFVPGGTFETQPHRFSGRVQFQSLEVDAALNGGALSAVVESSDSNFQTFSDSVRLTLQPGAHRYALRGLKAGRYVRVRFEFSSDSAWRSPALKSFVLHLTNS